MSRLQTLLTRGAVVLADAGRKLQELQLRLMAGEPKGGIEHLEGYGLTAHPLPGAEALAAFFGGDRSHGVVLVVADRRYRIAGLEAGEVCLYDDIGHRIHLTRSGIVIDGAGQAITLTNAPEVRMETDVLKVTGDIRDRCDVADGRTMAAMRDIYNGHDHAENDSGGPTDEPNQRM